VKVLHHNLFIFYTAQFKKKNKVENGPVHFRQQLVDGLSRVGMHGRLHSLPADAVQLIDEDDTGRVGFGLFCKPPEKKRREIGVVRSHPHLVARILSPHSANSLKRFLIRLAPTPTNISSNSDPEA